MNTIFIDNEFKCHTTNPDGTFREAALSDSAKTFFADKCTAFIEGYRLKPEGETWVREDGHVFSGGEMISPWKDYDLLEAAQAQYEADLAEAAAAYQEGVDSAYDQ